MAGTIADKIQAILASKADIASAIEEKGGTVPDRLSEYGDAIRALPSGDQEADVQFIDYDGTVLYKYTYAEAEALTELPALPSRTGFTNQGWNYTLAEMKSAMHGRDPDDIPISEVTAYLGLPDGSTFSDLQTLLDLSDNDTLGDVVDNIPELHMTPVVVGCTYITADGVTRIYVTIPPEDLTMCLAFAQTEKTSVLFDWGDGTTDTPGNPAQMTRSHTYAQAGDYVISFTCLLGYPSLILSGNLGGSGSVYYSSRIKKVELGQLASISNFVFSGSDVDSISIPSGVEIGINAVASTSRLKGFVVPRTTTDIPAGMLEFCGKMERVSIPKTTVSVGNFAFGECAALKQLSLPAVTTIGENMCQYCGSLTDVYMYGVSAAPYFSFSYCGSLKHLHTAGITSVGSSAFVGCGLLESIGDQDITHFGNTVSSAFSECVSLKSVGTLKMDKNSSDGTRSAIGSYCFKDCKSLRTLVIDPDDENVSLTIGNNAFYRANIDVFDFTACTKVANLENVNAFSGTPNDKIILIPVALTTTNPAWHQATNWTGFAAGWLAQPFNASKSYAVGDYCKYNGLYYKCKKAGAYAWSTNNWTTCTGVIVAV